MNYLKLSLLALLLAPSFAYAQNDQVYPKEGSVVIGSVAETSSGGIKVMVKGKPSTFAAGDIKKISFDGDSKELTAGRQLVLDGQYDQGIDELKKVELDKLPRDVIVADAVFFNAYALSQLALGGQGNKQAAKAAMINFASKYRDSWHFYEAAKTLGDLSLAMNDYDGALKFYGALEKSPTTTGKIEWVYLTGLANLKKGDTAAAETAFDKILGLKVDSVDAARLQALSKAGKASVLGQKKQADEGLKLVSLLIGDLNPVDVELNARTYNAQGALWESKGDAERAIIAYLHTHLLYSSQSDAHAIALSRLIELFTKVGDAARSAEVKQELQQRYPGFGQ